MHTCPFCSKRIDKKSPLLHRCEPLPKSTTTQSSEDTEDDNSSVSSEESRLSDEIDAEGKSATGDEISDTSEESTESDELETESYFEDEPDNNQAYSYYFHKQLNNLGLPVYPPTGMVEFKPEMLDRHQFRKTLSPSANVHIWCKPGRDNVIPL